jgi:hypothetical protein
MRIFKKSLRNHPKQLDFHDINGKISSMGTQKTLIHIILTLFIALPATLILAQGDISLFDYIAKKGNASVTIETSFKGLFKKNDEYQPAHLVIKAGDEVLLDTMGEVRTRGNSRKTICFMPPTKIRIDKKYLKNRGWATYPTLKVVNSCSYTDLAESYVHVEDLLYDIYNILTNRSYRTVSISLNYTDTDGKKKPTEFDGFLIEHEDQLAARMEGEILALNYFQPAQLERESYIIFTMFQYMIGNTDWKVLNKHNLEIIKVNKDRACYPIPFDFDYSGAVNATYAIPNESLPIKNIKERIYLGPCQTPEELTRSRAHFMKNKDAIDKAVEDSRMNERQKSLTRDFFSSFYKIIEDEKMAESVFTNCREY